jgi:hypothetical protein
LSFLKVCWEIFFSFCGDFSVILFYLSKLDNFLK